MPMRCDEVFMGGCDHPVGPGRWLHDDSEWTRGYDRPHGPYLHHNPPEHLLRQLAADADWRVRFLVANHPVTGPGLIDRLAQDPWPQVRWEGLRRTSSLALLRAARDDGDRVAVASNDRCPAALLERWGSDPYHILRDRVVGHPSTPAWVVDAAVGDPDGSVRALAAFRTRSPEVIAAAAASPDRGLRCGAARNPACPPALRDRLARDEDPAVRAAATRPPAPSAGRR
ncbi:HEAT repeat domain-containing protein [Actinoplanes sp. NPDC023801]|uniref:HEAT repeat domain-containing protein n=1 Tax=Actinoplanes sp. NPDC023801 TaxID=3154595 RepID=UPI0034114F50